MVLLRRLHGTDTIASSLPDPLFERKRVPELIDGPSHVFSVESTSPYFDLVDRWLLSPHRLSFVYRLFLRSRLHSLTMSPSTSHTSSQLRQLIYYNLDNNLIRNALFLAGRLHAFEPRSSEAAYLLALCHLHNGQVKAALDYSRNAGARGTHIGCSYVHAQACLDLGKYLDGVTALERSKGLWASKNHWSKHWLLVVKLQQHLEACFGGVV